jgi:hypothetical protein
MNEHKVQYFYSKLLLPRILQQIQMQFFDLGEWVGTVGYKTLFRVVLIITMDAGYRIWKLEDVSTCQNTPPEACLSALSFLVEIQDLAREHIVCYQW